MKFLKLPGMIDVHVHVREPGGTHKEDWDSATQAALAGGFTAILAMPNTLPPVTDADSLSMALNAAQEKARCDYAQFLGAGADNLVQARSLAARAAGLKMYLDQTYGPLRLDEMSLWMEHFSRWSPQKPVVAHAEGRTMAAVILLAALYDRPVHIAHVSLREEIVLIRKAKEQGIAVTCEVAPHHLFYPARISLVWGKEGARCARGLHPLATAMLYGKTWISLIALQRTTPPIPWRRKRARTRRQVSQVSRRLYLFC
jgi:carbamoyl-phosphate synthase / aspartate carbamoyltransferase / dihydroorotase